MLSNNAISQSSNIALEDQDKMRFSILLFIFTYCISLSTAQNTKNIEQTAVYFFNNNQMDSSAYYYDKAAKEAISNKDLLKYCDFKEKEGKIYYDAVEVEKSITLHQSLLNEYESFLNQHNPLILYQVCNRLGADYSYIDRRQLAKTYLDKAKNINEQYKLKERGVYLNLYQFFKDENNLTEAFFAISTYQSLCEELKDWKGLANAKFCFGTLFFSLSDYEKSITSHKNALSIYKEQNLESDYSKPLMGIGNCYYKLKRYREALDFYKQCYPYCSVPVKLGPCLVNIINTYVDMNELDSAKIYINKYETIRNKLKTYDIDKEFVNALAGYFENKKDYKQAINLLEGNKKFFMDGKFNLSLASINERLAKLYLQTGQTKLAFNLLENAYQIQDTLNKQRLSVLDSLTKNFMEEKNRVERQEQTNQILEQQNQIQKRTNFALLLLSALLLITLISVITNNRLRLKKEKAEKETIQKTEDFNTFRYSVSHDLRNPLLSAQQNLSKISNFLKEKDENDVVNTVEAVQVSLRGVSQFINRLKDFATSDNQAIFKSHFDCKKLVEAIFKEYQNQIESKNINVKIDDLPLLQTDKVLFSNILSNLISNAIKFSNTDTTAKIHVFFEQQSNSLCICDNGIGIDGNILPTLFQPFVRQYPEKEGAGLGLAIVKRLATQLETNVSLKNNDISNGGVTAKISLSKAIYK